MGIISEFSLRDKNLCKKSIAELTQTFTTIPATVDQLDLSNNDFD